MAPLAPRPDDGVRAEPGTTTQAQWNSQPGLRTVAIFIDGEQVQAVPGRSLASVLMARDVVSWRTNIVTGQPRGPFCGMGVCFECELAVDGQPAVRACSTTVRAGMRVETDAASGVFGLQGNAEYGFSTQHNEKTTVDPPATDRGPERSVICDVAIVGGARPG